MTQRKMKCLTRWTTGLCLATALLVPIEVQAQDPVTVVPGEGYGAGALRRFILGSGYRNLWTTPIVVPVLDLETFAGGLTPVSRGGGVQTASLRLRAADGTEYSFRSVNKDPSSALPEELRETILGDILRDQTSSGHPVGAVVVAQLLDTVAVVHAHPVLAVMADDARLGEFRQEFAGMLGLLEVRPDESEDGESAFVGAIRIVGADTFDREIENDPLVRPDAREFLRARMMDIFLGDWDRHRDQWRWALTEQGGPRRWMPIPRDRDQAFAKYDGLLLAMGRRAFPQFVNFGPKYSGLVGQTWNGRDLDRRILPDLNWDVWNEVATELQSRLTDEALQRAVGALPAAYQTPEHDRLLSSLRSRRDQFVEEARRFYLLLAREVDIHGSDRSDSAMVTRLDEGRVRVQLRADTSDVPYYDRTFSANETNDIRIWLHGGDDRGEARGTGGGPTVRFLGGGGDDHFVNVSAGGRTRFYDDRGTNTASGGAINDRPYVPESEPAAGMPPPRDWGSKLEHYFVTSLGPDVGVVVTANVVFTRFGFRKQPQASRIAWSGSWATGASTFNSVLEGDWWKEHSGLRFGFRARGSGIEVLRWHGQGNDSDKGSSDEFNRVLQHVVAVDPHLGLDFGQHNTFEVGPSVKFSFTGLSEGKNARRFIATDQPFGTGNFWQLGTIATLLHDSRDRPVGASHGAAMRATGSWFPIADGDAFGSVVAEAAKYWSPAGRNAPTLALRVGGKKVWGNYPFFEAATVGGNTSRGFRPDRFAGDAAAWANGEIRIKVVNARLIVPGELGLFGFGDVGRVWVNGQSPGTWHPSAGGGLWFGILSRSVTVSVSAGWSREGTRFYAGSGFGF